MVSGNSITRAACAFLICVGNITLKFWNKTSCHESSASGYTAEMISGVLVMIDQR